MSATATRRPGQRISALGGGYSSPEAKRLGLNPSELRIVLAAMACERAEFGFPSGDALASVADVSKRNIANLVATRWLEKAGKEGRVFFYRAGARAWRELGFSK